MNTANNNAKWVDDLAGHWTDSALEILKAAGMSAVSVDVELATWHTLKIVLQSELCRQPTLSAEAVKATVLQRAILLVAQKFAPWFDRYEWENRIRRYFQMAQQSHAKTSLRSSRRTDTFPRFQILAVGG